MQQFSELEPERVVILSFDLLTCLVVDTVAISHLLITMRFVSSALLAALTAHSARAFAPSKHAFVPHRTFTSSTTLSMANVLRLSEPQSQLLDQVDVFIFDCDGVIWRVRICLLVIV
jgi:hypothetical protein